MRTAVKFGDVTMIDTLLKDGLMDSFANIHMGITGRRECHVFCCACIN